MGVKHYLEAPAPSDEGILVERLLQSTDPVIKAAAARLLAERRASQCDLPTTMQQVSWARPRNDGVLRNVGVCVQVRNDANILDEYIAFHWLQGVSHFVIYDDGSDDDPWSVLAKYQALGIVEYRDFSGHSGSTRRALQLDNLNACLCEMRQRHAELGLRWIAFTDVDEFLLTSQPGRTLSEVLTDDYRETACLAVDRTIYGTSFYHRRPPNGTLVTEAYLLSDKEYRDGHPKVIANICPEGGRAKRNATRLRSVHKFEDFGIIPCTPREAVRDVRINHYVRSLQDYERKVLTLHTAVKKYDSPLEVFWSRDHNDHYSPIAAEYGCQVRALMELVKQMVANDKIPQVDRPPRWNETSALGHWSQYGTGDGEEEEGEDDDDRGVQVE